MLTKKEGIELLKKGEYLQDWGRYSIAGHRLRADIATKLIKSGFVMPDVSKTTRFTRYYKWVGGT